MKSILEALFNNQIKSVDEVILKKPPNIFQ
jgi:hypothetical protein